MVQWDKPLCLGVPAYNNVWANVSGLDLWDKVEFWAAVVESVAGTAPMWTGALKVGQGKLQPSFKHSLLKVGQLWLEDSYHNLSSKAACMNKQIQSCILLLSQCLTGICQYTQCLSHNCALCDWWAGVSGIYSKWLSSWNTVGIYWMVQCLHMCQDLCE